MRLGLIGLGRIGAFHADTLSHLDGVDSLVVTDAVPSVTAAAAAKFGADAADSPEALIKTDKSPLRNLDSDTTWPAGKPWTFFMDRLAGAFRAELTAFTDVVAGRRRSPCTVDDALAVTWMAEAATLSLTEHRPVRIEEVQL
jgi:predicted dehydrogenase